MDFGMAVFIAVLFTREMALANILILKKNFNVILEKSAWSVADENTSSQRFEEAACLLSELEAFTILVTLRNIFLLGSC